MSVDRRRFISGATALSAFAAFGSAAQSGVDPAIDAIVEAFMAAFDMPGCAVAVLRPGQSDHIKGYGVRRLGGTERVDAHTLFGIASNTKAMTCALLAMLVEEGRMGWDDLVTRHLPEFRMFDPLVTQMITVRDLVTHRAGLGLGQGDLMLFPLSDHTRDELMRAVRHLKPYYGFRSGYAYNNVLFTVAGMVIERVTGHVYEEVLTERVLKAVGMEDAVVGLDRIRTENVSGRHARLGPPLRGLGDMRDVAPEEGAPFAPAAGVLASVSDAVPWLRTQLNKGVTPAGQRLWSEVTHREMWKPQTLVGSGVGPTPERPTASLFNTYGLGWFIQDYRGRRLVSHSGGLLGMTTQHALLPEQGIAVAVYTNIEDGTSGRIRNSLIDYLLGAEYDWLGASIRQAEQTRTRALDDMPKAEPAQLSLPLSAFAGRYRSDWYGDVIISEKPDGLWIDFTRTLRLKGAMQVYGKDRFRTLFAPGWGDDVLLDFDISGDRVTDIRCRAFSPLADFSFDYQNLDLKRVY